MKRIILPLWVEIFIAFALGIILAYYKLSFLACIFMSFILLAYYILSCKLARYMLIPAFILLTGSIYFDLNKVGFPSSLPAEADNFAIKGKIISYPRCDDSKCSFILETGDERLYSKKIQVFAYFDVGLNRGDEIWIRGRLFTPDEPGNPGEFDYAGFLAKEKIRYILSADEEKDFKLVKKAAGINLVFNYCREQTEKVVKDTLPDKEAGILLGMLLGKKEEISPAEYREFQKSGIVHIFAVSGLHVGFLVLLTSFILSWLSLTPGAKTVGYYIVLLLYGSIVGWPVSVIRAVIMALVMVTAFYLKRGSNPLNSLGLAGFIILLLDPYSLFKIGFQLSIAATWGLLYIYPQLKKTLGCQKWWLDLLFIPFSAQLAVLPLIAYYFHLFTPAALITNIFVSYLAGGAIIAGFLGMISSLVFPFLSPVFLYPAGFMIHIMQAVVKIANLIPFSYIWVKIPDIWLVIFYYAGVLILCHALLSEYKKGTWAGALILLAFFVFLLWPPSYYNRGILEVTFVDVGQGDSIFIKTPQGKFILLDGGGSRLTEVEERKLLPFLHSRGINRFYMLINSHPDIDHLKGLEKVAKEHKTHFLCIPASLAAVPEYQDIKSAVLNQEGKVLYLRRGQEIYVEKDLVLEIMHPGGKYSGGKYNDYSLVIYMKYRDFSILLVGDIEEKGIKELLAKGGFKTADVVKVPHHGSRGSLSPEFYDQVDPRLAVISVGKNNFGHPHAEVLDLLQDKKIKILRTDHNGAITLLSDGSEGRITTFKP